MCHQKNKFLLSMQRILLLALCHFILAESASNELISPIGDACPGNVLMYTCTIVGGGNTIWSGTAFDCSSKSNEIILRHSQFDSELGTFGNCNEGAITAHSLGVVNNNCYSSQLNVTIDSDMNNKTIQCAHSSVGIVTIDVAILSIATAPPTHVTLDDIRPGKLIFNWRASSDRLNYTLSSTCGTCPIMTNATIAICTDFNLSTTLTMCTFSVRSVACGTIGTPSLPVVVTLGVPAAPDIRIIPQYNGRQSLTGIIVQVEQNVTSFPITDTMSGSTTSYMISYSGMVVENLRPCVNSTCNYTINTSSVCSTSSDVNITATAANRLGQGRPSEPITIECNNQFVSVDYYPEAMTITCTFENKLDISPKSCSVKYGTCDEEMYFAQGNTTDGPIILKLISSARDLNCYIVTASNDTLTVMVKGNLVTHRSNSGALSTGEIVTIVVLMVIGLSLLITIITTILVYFQARYRRHANQHKPRIEARNEQSIMDEMGMNDYDIVALQISSLLIRINSVPFKISKVEQKHTLDELKSKFGEYVFLEHTQKKEEGKENILDAIRSDKDGKLFSTPDVQHLISQEQPRGSRVFVLPLNYSEQEVIHQNESILHQNPDQLKQKFRVLYVGRKTEVSIFLSQHNLEFECEVVLCPFPKTGMDLHCYRDIVRISNSEIDKLLRQCKKSSPKEVLIECDTGIHMFYDLKHHDHVPDGRNIKPPDAIEEYFIQITTEELNSHLKLEAGSLILVYKGPQDHRASVM